MILIIHYLKYLIIFLEIVLRNDYHMDISFGRWSSQGDFSLRDLPRGNDFLLHILLLHNLLCGNVFLSHDHNCLMKLSPININIYQQFCFEQYTQLAIYILGINCLASCIFLPPLIPSTTPAQLARLNIYLNLF